MTIPSDDKAAVEVSSPACSMPEADDAYMGYAGKDELTALLNELLEAERAGARVTLESARAAGSGLIAELMWRIQRDEARWCAMLADHVRLLGGSPTPTVGAFYGKAMAIVDLGERINRGQAGWCESCANYCPARAAINYMPISPRCCDRTRLTSPSPPTLRATPVNDADTVYVDRCSCSLRQHGTRCVERSNSPRIKPTESWVEHSQFRWSATWMRPRSRPGVG